MASQDFDDETLMAYADGELDPGTARSVEAAAAADPEIAARMALFDRTRDLLHGAARARLALLPADLEVRLGETIRAGGIPPEPVVRAAPAPATGPARRWEPMALAASLALALGLAGGLVLSRATGDGGEGGLRIAALDSPGIVRALETLPSGQRQALEGGEVATIASFRNADGEFCREFEVDRARRDTLVSVACRTETGWKTRFVVLAAGSQGTGYAPASALETLDAYLTGIGAGAPLSLEEEAAVLEAGAP